MWYSFKQKDTPIQSQELTLIAVETGNDKVWIWQI